MKHLPALLAALWLGACLSACGTAARPPTPKAAGPTPDGSAAPSAGPEAESGSAAPEDHERTEADIPMKIHVQIGGQAFTATPEDNAAAQALIEMLRQVPVSVEMRDYSGFEKVGPLGGSLPADDRQTTTGAGDIVLYEGDQIVMFYGSNTWSYTRLGHIDDLTGWEDALGGGSITAVFSLAEQAGE